MTQTTPKAAETTTPKQPGSELALLKKNITDSVMERLQPMLDSKQLRIPENYAAGNALHEAWFVLLEIKDKDKRPALEVCTKESVANSLFKMVTMGLSAAKKQVAFIVYGNKLVCQQEYHGTIALAKRFGGVKQVNAGVVYKKDVFKYSVNTETGRKKITEHSQELENIDDANIRGAYAVLTFEGGEPYVEVMTMEQIHKAWAMGQQRGQGDVHKNFTGEMAKKTVIGRACKLFITSSDDAALFTDDEDTDMPRATRDETVKEKGSKKELSMAESFEDVTAQVIPDPEPVQDHQPSQEPVTEPAEAPY